MFIQPFHCGINLFPQDAFLFLFGLLFHLTVTGRISAVRIIILAGIDLYFNE